MRSARILLAASACLGGANAAASEAALNPIRKVVNLLQAMQQKVEAEGEKEKELYDQFMCWCKHGSGDLSSSISSANDKIPQVSSNIEASEGKLSQTKEDLKAAQEDRSSANAAMKEAVALREKEAAAFAGEKAEADTNIAAMEKAIAALERGMAGGFLQTPTAKVLSKLAQSSQDIVVDADRQMLVAFLSGSSEYAPQSGQITGILKQMHETMSKNLAESTATEEAAIKDHEELMAAKSKEVEALSAAIESKNKMIGELGVEIVEMKEDLDDTQNALAADQKYLAELQKGCATKTAEWEERSKLRADELVALADTIKVLNDDDALELFKKTLPSPSSSFVQVAAKASTVRARALEALRNAKGAAAQSDRTGLDLLMLALAGKKSLSQGGFDKVIKMCDEMVEVLKQEQLDDDNKKEYCGTQFDLSDDSKKQLEREISDHENAIATAKETIATLTEEIAALEAGIKQLDKAVAEATEQRKAENIEFKELMSSNGAAKEVLAFAKNRLLQYYNPKLYKAPPKRELSAQGRIEASISGTEPPTTAPGGIADTGITALLQLSASKDAPAPPPETWDAYATKSEENTGVIAMIDLLIKDLDKEMTEATTQEKEDQADYEEMMKDSAEKRAADSKALTEKGAAKADIEEEKQSREEGKASATKEHMATMKYIASLHSECDWLLQYFDVRKEARAGEIDSIVKAKAVLSGADYSLVQTRAHRFLRGA